MRTLTHTAVLSSQINVSSYYDLPNLSALELVFTPQQQKLDYLFSDAVHMNNMVGGAGLTLQTFENEGRLETKLVKRLLPYQGRPLMKGLLRFKGDDPYVMFNGADVLRLLINVTLYRTFILSSLENDLKYRLLIHEFYLDKSQLQLALVFNKSSTQSARGRESLLRLNNLPVRVVKRLVKN